MSRYLAAQERPMDSRTTKRTASYADALRGHMVLTSRTKPTADKKIESTATAKAVLARSRKPISDPGAEFPPLGKSANDTVAKPPVPSTRTLAEEPPLKPEFSYAGAVKGTLPVALDPEKRHTGGEDKLNRASSTRATDRDADIEAVRNHGIVAPASDIVGREENTNGPSRKEVDEDVVRHVRKTRQRPALNLEPAIDSEPGVNSDSPTEETACKSSGRRSHADQKPSPHSTSGLAPVLDKPRCFSAGDVPATPHDPFLEAAIQQALTNEARRRRMAREKAIRTRALIAAHDRGEISLWESQYEWDVLLQCGHTSWRAHHDILCRESDWFSERLPPKDINGGYVTLDLRGHDKIQLANVLKFMYTPPHLTTLTCLTDPYDGEPIRRSVFNYICGASVDCQRMMLQSTDAIDHAAEQLGLFFAHLPPARLRGDRGLAGLYMPLGGALAIMYDQGPTLDDTAKPHVMVPLRLAMANLVEGTLMWLLRNHGFRRAFAAGWAGWLYLNIVNDNLYFQRLGVLRTAVNTATGTGGNNSEATANKEDLPRKKGGRRVWKWKPQPREEGDVSSWTVQVDKEDDDDEQDWDV